MARISASTAALPADDEDDDARQPCLASTVCLVLSALAANCGRPVASDHARGIGGTGGADFEDDMAITELARL